MTTKNTKSNSFSNLKINSPDNGVKISGGMMEIEDLAPTLSGEDGWPITLDFRGLSQNQADDFIALAFLSLIRGRVVFNVKGGEEKSHPNAMSKVLAAKKRWLKKGFKAKAGRDGFSELENDAREIMLKALDSKYDKRASNHPRYGEVKDQISQGAGKQRPMVTLRNHLWNDEAIKAAFLEEAARRAEENDSLEI